MSKQTRRKYLSQVSRRSHQDTRSQVDPASLIKKRKKILEIRAARRKYHPLVVEEKMMIVVVVKKNQTKESHGILTYTENLRCWKGRPFLNRMKTKKGW